MPVKTHHTAVVAIPPPEVWEPLQAIRRQHDRNVHRWMPHITLLYPFMPREHFGEALPKLLEVGRQSAAFQVTLTDLPPCFEQATPYNPLGLLWLESREGVDVSAYIW